jgi:hypothetical protein
MTKEQSHRLLMIKTDCCTMLQSVINDENENNYNDESYDDLRDALIPLNANTPLNNYKQNLIAVINAMIDTHDVNFMIHRLLKYPGEIENL